VTDDQQNIEGIITRGVVERAILHELSDSPISDYMLTEYASVEVNAPIELVQENIIEKRQRMLPVVDGRKVKGVITRTDLLEAMHEDFKRSKAYEEFKGVETARAERVRNIQELMKEVLDRKTMKILLTAGEVAYSMGFRTYLVGGLVRDIMLRIRNLDVDLVVEGDGVEYGRKLARRLKARIRTHKKFQTAVLIMKDGFKLDVATARTEYYDAPGAYPMVERGSIKLDLYRRDFSINALAIRLDPGSFGQIVDFFGGQRDLKERTIRILHNLSFVDDPTRMIRAIRFEQKFGFRIGKHTEYLLKGAVRREYIQRAQGMRVLGEIMAVLREGHPENAFQRMDDLGILKAIHPSLAFDEKTREVFRQVEKIHTWFQYLYLDEHPDIAGIYLNAAMFLRSKKDRRGILKVFHVQPHWEKNFEEGWAQISSTLRALAQPGEQKPSWINNILSDLRTEDLILIMALTKREPTARAISLYLSRLRFIKSEVDGKILKAMGYESGPLFGKIMKAVQDARVDGEVNTLQEEKEWIVRNFPL
jgi:tRNA nucleotidyltransferase (CCA-adding enzyme)